MKYCTSKGNGKTLILILFFLVISLGRLSGQTTLPRLAPDGSLMYENEPPQSLFTYSLGSSELDFFLLGSWEAKLGFAAGISWIPRRDGGYDQQDLPPSVLRPTPLTNVVDLVTSLWIDDSFFFESSFRSGFADNSILIGYYGEGLLREAKLGNTDIGIQSYPFLETAGGITGSPGVAATLVTDQSLHEFMIRYETTSEVRRSFIGNSEYTIENIKVQDFTAGTYFLLPDQNPENLKVWLEEGNSDFGTDRVTDNEGIRYRLLRPAQDYGIVADLGELTLNPALPEGRVLVHYFINGRSVSDAAHVGGIPVVKLGGDDPGVSKETVNFSLNAGSEFETHFVNPLNELLGFTNTNPGVRLADFSRNIGSATAVVLYEPNVFSPFEIQAYYTHGTEVEDIRFKGNNARSVSFQTSSNGVQLSTQGGIDRSSEPWKIRYPLLAIDDRVSYAYGPGSSKQTEKSGMSQFLLQFRSRIGEGIRIEDTIVPGSLFVYRNSTLASNVTLIDGLLIFSEPVNSLDNILVVYRVRDQSGRSGNVSAASGHRFFLPSGDEIELAIGGSIGIEGENTKQVPGGNPAYIQLSAAYHLDRPQFNADFEVVLGYSVADTNEFFYPLRTISDNKQFAINEISLFPSPLPEINQLGAGTALAASVKTLIASLTNNNRGVQHFRNFRGVQGILPRDNYQNGSEPTILTTAIGPYPVLPGKNDSIEGTLAALEFEMTAGEWVGYQTSTSDGKSIDGFISGFEISVLPESLNQDVHIFLQAGDLGEDLDGDFVLDSQLRPEDRGLAFTQNGTNVYAGYPGRSYYNGWQGVTEDVNKNGRLDSDNPPAMVSLYLGEVESSEAGRWKKFQYTFNSRESSRLTEFRSLRIVVLTEQPASGRLFFGNQKIPPQQCHSTWDQHTNKHSRKYPRLLHLTVGR